MADIPLDHDMLPCLNRVGGRKFPYPSKPDSFEDLASAYKSARKAAPRTQGKKIVYDADSSHNILHRPASDTRKALANSDVRFETADGVIKAGTDLTDQDLSYGPCHVCKHVRAVAATKNSKGVTSFVCGTCSATDGTTYTASKRE